MNNLDYQDPFAGGSNQAEFQELAKALSTQATYGLTDQTGGAAFRLESIQGTLKSATFMETAAKFWQMVGKKKAGSTIEEYSLWSDPGDGEFYTEGGLPQEQDSVYTRAFEVVKFLGAVGKISNQAMAVRNLVDLKAQETLSRTLGVIRKLNKTLYFGDATCNPLEFPGLLYQMTARANSENVIDCAGKRLRLEEINTAARIISDNYGTPSHLFISNEAKEYYVKELIASKTYFVNDASVMRVGVNPNEWLVGNGQGIVVQDVFLKSLDPGAPRKNQAGTFIKEEGQPPSAATSSKAPATPVIGVVTTPAHADSAFASGDATNYDYRITAINQYGESLYDTELTVAVVAGDEVLIPVTEGGGAYATTAYKVYRKKSTESTYYYIFQTAYSASPQSLSDKNLYRHGTTMAFLMDFNVDQVLAYHQLLPFFSMPLAIIDDSVRWLLKLYGTLMVYNPNKIVILKNIGATAWS